MYNSFSYSRSAFKLIYIITGINDTIFSSSKYFNVISEAFNYGGAASSPSILFKFWAFILAYKWSLNSFQCLYLILSESKFMIIGMHDPQNSSISLEILSKTNFGFSVSSKFRVDSN